jgi:hypothetical protein
VPTDPTVRCVDCGVDLMPDTPPGSRDWQRYMVHDHVWSDAGMDPDGGWLCVGCLEARLRRPLTGADFPELPLNHRLWKHSADDTERVAHLKLQAALVNKTRLWESLYDWHHRTGGGRGRGATLTPRPVAPASRRLYRAENSPSCRSGPSR